MRAAVRFALTAVLFVSPLAAQVRENINVNVIEVPVTVLDRNGNPVRGLTAANFELLDSGTKRDISSFDAIDFASQDPKSVSPLNPAARRTFVLLFDLSYGNPHTLERAQAAAGHFIARNVQRRDLVAVASVDADKGFRILTSFTTDRNLVAAAIADPYQFHGADPLQIASISLSEIVGPARAGIDQAPVGKDADQAYELKRMQDKQDLEFRRHKIELQLGALDGLAKTLRNVPGRKQIIFLSEGFDPSVLRGRDVRDTENQQQEAEEVFNGNLWRVNTDERYGSAAGLATLRRMAQTFRSADVVLNAIDIRGVRVQNDVQKGAMITSNDALYLLAQPTGGIVIDNANDLTEQFSRLMHAEEVVYVLAFRAPTQHPGKFHDVKVKLVNVPGARALYRAGYYEMGGQNAVERTLSTAQIVINDLPQSDIGLGVIATAFPNGGPKSMVPVVLEIDGPGLMKDVRRNDAALDVFVYAFDEDGNVRDTLFQRLRLDISKVSDKLRATGVKYYGTLSLPAGKYAIRSLVRVEETDRKGYARSDLVVGGGSDVALLPPLFPDPDLNRWVVVRGTEHDKSPFPFMISGEPFLPTMRVAAAEHRFTVFALNASPDEVTWETTPAAKLVSQQRDQQSDILKAVFQLDSFDSSISHVDVTLHRKGSTEVRSASIPIRVR